VSTRSSCRIPAESARRPLPSRPGSIADAVEEVAIVAQARRDLLLRAHRFRLRKEDLEDCYSQATLELIGHARRGGRYAGSVHLARVLEQRFVSRIHDRRRAVSGRSSAQAALESAVPLANTPEEGQLDVADWRPTVEQLVILRQELNAIREFIPSLSTDQRLVLASQVDGLTGPDAFCRRHGWSAAKYRKVAQRARARLRELLAASESPVPPRARRRIGSQGPNL
jgi:DNA-directed RNA polymerase specialized sigma24 family protein